MLLSWSLAVMMAAVEVRGAGVCPAPADVVAAQHALGATEPSPWIAELEELPEGLRLRLRAPSGEEVASRELRTRASCPERATAAAVVLSAWEAELAGSQRQAPVLPPLPTWNVRLGAEASLGVTEHSGARWLPAGALIGQLWLGESRLGWMARAMMAVPASSPLGSADAVWMRPLVAVEAGPWLRFGEAHGEWLAELTAGVALVRVWGEGFAVDEASTGLDVSLAPGLRWIGGAGSWRPSASVGGVFWLVPQRLSVTGASARVLPQWEVRASVGLLWGR